MLENCIIAGDFNASSPVWNPQCTQRRDAAFLEELRVIDTHELEVENDSQTTRPDSECHSIIGLTLTTPGAACQCQDWRILSDNDDTTDSDHVVIEWRWTGPAPAGRVDRSWKVKGWVLKERLEKKSS